MADLETCRNWGLDLFIVQVRSLSVENKTNKSIYHLYNFHCTSFRKENWLEQYEFWLIIRRSMVQISASKPAMLTEVLRGFSQSHQNRTLNLGMTSSFHTLSNSLLTLIPSFNATQSFWECQLQINKQNSPFLDDLPQMVTLEDLWL